MRLGRTRAEACHEAGATLYLWKRLHGGTVRARWDGVSRSWYVEAAWTAVDPVLGSRLKRIALFDLHLSAAFRKLAHELNRSYNRKAL